jgi:hypothetical protein
VHPEVREAGEQRVSAHRDIHGSHPHGGLVAKEGDDRLADTLAGAYRHEGRECPSGRVVKAQLGEMM